MERIDNLGLPPGAEPQPSAVSAESLLRAFQAHGDAASLGQLYERVSPALVAAAQPITGDRALAEDAVHEAFLDLYEMASRYDGERPAMPWLVGIVRRKALKIRRHEGRRVAPERLVRATSEEAAAQRGRGAPGLIDTRPIDSLTGPYRAVARLRWQYDLSPVEIAALRGERPGTTRSLLSRALARLRRTWDVSAGILIALLGAGRWLVSPRARYAGRVTSSSATAAGGSHGLLGMTLATVLGGCTAWLTLDTVASSTHVASCASVRAEPVRLIHSPRPLIPADGESAPQER